MCRVTDKHIHTHTLKDTHTHTLTHTHKHVHTHSPTRTRRHPHVLCRGMQYVLIRARMYTTITCCRSSGTPTNESSPPHLVQCCRVHCFLVSIMPWKSKQNHIRPVRHSKDVVTGRDCEIGPIITHSHWSHCAHTPAHFAKLNSTTVVTRERERQRDSPVEYIYILY